jgi:hypothetical protein
VATVAERRVANFAARLVVVFRVRFAATFTPPRRAADFPPRLIEVFAPRFAVVFVARRIDVFAPRRAPDLAVRFFAALFALRLRAGASAREPGSIFQSRWLRAVFTGCSACMAGCAAIGSLAGKVSRKDSSRISW